MKEFRHLNAASCGLIGKAIAVANEEAGYLRVEKMETEKLKDERPRPSRRRAALEFGRWACM